MSSDLLTQRRRSPLNQQRLEIGRDSGRGPDRAPAGVRLAQLLGRLSLAFDIAGHAPYGSAVRAVVLAVELGRRAGATDDELRDAFWESLLGGLGAAHDASSNLARAVGAEAAVPGGDTPTLATRLVQFGRIAEKTHGAHGRDGVVALVRRAGDRLDPRLAQLFAEGRDELFAAIEDRQIFDRFLALEPDPVAYADDDRVDEVARALAIFADLQCPIFIGHSTGVAALAEQAAAQLGLGSEETRWLRRAALLHDVGRLGVSNAIWTRSGRLDWAELEQVRLHAYYTERLLAPIAELGPAAEIAAAAHERLDGAGYPQRRPGRSLQMAARVLAVADMAVAMGEARPHRPPLSPADISRELAAGVAAGRADASATDAVLAVLGLEGRVGFRNPGGVSDRELDVCRLIARGKMNKEIAELLGISLRTVQTHVAHVFDKLGIHSRSGIAVWLIENDAVQ
jgi:HD-GYP domain-containing protein (c-di-GMP phosphodiesterase class II)/DNA-binding CsgD family transcriptional regulator